MAVRRAAAALLVVGSAVGLLVAGGAVQRAAAEPAAVNLGDAAPYAVLARGAVTGSGTPAVGGDVGGATVGGLDGRVTGAVRTGDDATQALADLDEADDTLVSATATGTLTGVGGTLGPGVYDVPGPVDVTGGLTLDAGGDAGASFVVRTGSTLATGEGVTVTLAGGARACHVFWLVDGTATVAGTVVGTVLARSGVTARAGAVVTGRLLSKDSVALESAAVHRPADCA